MANQLRIEIDLEDALADEPAYVTIAGAKPAERIMLHSRLVMSQGDIWESELRFVADEDGRVELATSSPIEGPYSEPHPMGFVWAMSQTKAAELAPKPALRSAPPLKIEMEALGEEGQRAARTLSRRYIADGVSRREIREEGLIATLFEPEGSRPNPVVVCLSGSEGGLNENRAALFAAHGYSALALAYFGVDPLPAGAREVPLEYFKTAFDYLVDQGICLPGSIAVDGASYGGQLSLLLGATFPEVSCVIAQVPSGLVHSSVNAVGDSTVTSSWTRGGEPLPYVLFRPERVDWTADEIALTPGYLACFEFEEEVKAATISVENTCGPILMLSVEDDQMWPSKEFAEVSEARLREHDFPHEFEHVCYKDAGHIAVLTPFVPIYLPAQVHPVIGRMFAFGGNLLANQEASEDAWRRTLERLNTTFRTG